MYHDKMRSLVRDALAAGAERRSVMRIAWDVAGNCTSPVTRELHSRPSADQPPRARGPVWQKDPLLMQVLSAFPGSEIGSVKVPAIHRDHFGRRFITVNSRAVGGDSTPLNAVLQVRCRKCEACLRMRAYEWMSRAVAEYKAGVRNWFGTLTLSPQAHMHVLSRARARLSLQGIDFDQLTENEQFKERHGEISQEITLFLKRVRKKVGPETFNFLCVAEAHKSGLPHYHMLVHERDPARPVRKAVLDAEWKLGFSSWKLIEDQRQAAYVCKYLSKSSLARVRASVRYGQDCQVRSDLPETLSQHNEEWKRPREGGRCKNLALSRGPIGD